MKRLTLITAALIILAPLAQASVAIQKEAKAKNPSTNYACSTCHTKLPGTKDNLTPEGEKWKK